MKYYLTLFVVTFSLGFMLTSCSTGKGKAPGQRTSLATNPVTTTVNPVEAEVAVEATRENLQGRWVTPCLATAFPAQPYQRMTIQILGNQLATRIDRYTDAQCARRFRTDPEHVTSLNPYSLEGKVEKNVMAINYRWPHPGQVRYDVIDMHQQGQRLTFLLGGSSEAGFDASAPDKRPKIDPAVVFTKQPENKSGFSAIPVTESNLQGVWSSPCFAFVGGSSMRSSVDILGNQLSGITRFFADDHCTTPHPTKRSFETEPRAFQIGAEQSAVAPLVAAIDYMWATRDSYYETQYEIVQILQRGNERILQFGWRSDPAYDGSASTKRPKSLSLSLWTKE